MMESVDDKVFWEKVGLELKQDTSTVSWWYKGDMVVYVDRIQITDAGCWGAIDPCALLPITLDNLFKYATVMVKEKIGEKEYFKLLVRWCVKVALGEDPAPALKKAVGKVL